MSPRVVNSRDNGGKTESWRNLILTVWYAEKIFDGRPVPYLKLLKPDPPVTRVTCSTGGQG